MTYNYEPSDEDSENAFEPEAFTSNFVKEFAQNLDTLIRTDIKLQR